MVGASAATLALLMPWVLGLARGAFVATYAVLTWWRRVALPASNMGHNLAPETRLGSTRSGEEKNTNRETALPDVKGVQKNEMRKNKTKTFASSKCLSTQ